MQPAFATAPRAPSLKNLVTLRVTAEWRDAPTVATVNLDGSGRAPQAVAQFTPWVHGAFGFVIQSVARSAKRGISVARRRIHFALNGLCNSLLRTPS